MPHVNLDKRDGVRMVCGELAPIVVDFSSKAVDFV